MHRALTLLVYAIAGLALVAEPADAGPSGHGIGRCVPSRTERVAARSASTVVLVRRTRLLIGCSLASGRRRVVRVIERNDSSLFERIRIRGTSIAYVVLAAESHESVQRLYRDDAVHRGRRRLLATGTVTAVAVGPGGLVAFVTGGAPGLQLVLDRPHAGQLLVDQGFKLDTVRFSVTGRLGWRHGQTAMTASTRETDHCTLGRDAGTLDVALARTPTSVTACWRATGASRTLTADQVTTVAVGGSWIAIATGDSRIVMTELLTAAGETVPDTAVTELAIDADGSFAWTTPADASSLHQVWAHDAAGTRKLDDTLDLTCLGFDRSTLRWGPKTATLSP